MSDQEASKLAIDYGAKLKAGKGSEALEDLKRKMALKEESLKQKREGLISELLFDKLVN